MDIPLEDWIRGRIIAAPRVGVSFADSLRSLRLVVQDAALSRR
jgi:hypothetical protein